MGYCPFLCLAKRDWMILRGNRFTSAALTRVSDHALQDEWKLYYIGTTTDWKAVSSDVE